MAKQKLKLGYDNIDDAKMKLQQTFCLYKGRAFTVKQVYMSDNDDTKYLVTGQPMIGRAQIGEVNINDPEFNCSDYNIGYLNAHGVAAWFYRIPYKQYRQGLRQDQIALKVSNPAYSQIEFRHSVALGNMLENKYPTYKDAATTLMSQESTLIAFHRNFAMCYDSIHGDFVLEYKGVPIGFTPNLEDFKLIKEHEHLFEALKEAIAR